MAATLPRPLCRPSLTTFSRANGCTFHRVLCCCIYFAAPPVLVHSLLSEVDVRPLFSPHSHISCPARPLLLPLCWRRLPERSLPLYHTRLASSTLFPPPRFPRLPPCGTWARPASLPVLCTSTLPAACSCTCVGVPTFFFCNKHSNR